MAQPLFPNLMYKRLNPIFSVTLIPTFPKALSIKFDDRKKLTNWIQWLKAMKKNYFWFN